MRILAALASLLLLAVGCTRPEVEAFRRNPAPVAVSFRASAESAAAAEVEKEYAAALRARLASRVVVVPDQVPLPPQAVELRVEVSSRERRPRGESEAVGVGVATGVAVGILGAVSGNRHAFWDGLFWGLWTGSRVAEHERYDRYNRRYYVIPPNAVWGEARLLQSGQSEPLAIFEVSPREVLDAMDPLKPSEQEDRGRVREEEAKAFARVLVSKLADYFDWPLSREPRWYQAPEKAKENPQ